MVHDGHHRHTFSMNSCFEKFVEFKGIMSDGLKRIADSKKQSTFFNFIKITQKNINFPYFIKLQEYWGNFESSYETNNPMENIMRLILEKFIMSDRHMSDGQLYSFLQLFSTLKKLA